MIVQPLTASAGSKCYNGRHGACHRAAVPSPAVTSASASASVRAHPWLKICKNQGIQTEFRPPQTKKTILRSSRCDEALTKKAQPRNLTPVSSFPKHNVHPPVVPSPLPSDGRGEGQGEVRILRSPLSPPTFAPCLSLVFQKKSYICLRAFASKCLLPNEPILKTP